MFFLKYPLQNLQQEQWDKNKNLDKKDRSYLKASKIDNQ